MKGTVVEPRFAVELLLGRLVSEVDSEAKPKLTVAKWLGRVGYKLCYNIYSLLQKR